MASALRFRGDAAHEEPAVTVEAFVAQPDASAVRIEAGDDARVLLPYLGRISLVEIDFPHFRDGRGYSAAAILRAARYAGELRATGDVLVDQILHMRRIGFDSFRPDQPLDVAAVERALARYDHVYQEAADGRIPVWALRHG